MKQERTDVHRPSVIEPADYCFIGIWYDPNEVTEVGGAFLLRYEREMIKAHMEKTQGTWSKHSHGGTCHVCGAHAVYLAVFHHIPSNTYIRVGEDCTIKMDMGEPERFASARRSIKNARDAIAGRRKAELILSDLGMTEAWTLFNLKVVPELYEEKTIVDMVRNLVKYGSLSDKQEAFMKKLLHTIANREAIAAERKAEKEAAAPCPTGRLTVTGTVISIKRIEGIYGSVLKMLVKTTEGYTLWGSVPSGIEAEKGSVVTFKATIEPARDDPKHGFFSRPSAQKK